MNSREPASGRTSLAELSYSKTWWLLTTAIAVALILGLGTLEAIRLLALPLAVLIFALTLAAALEPLVARSERRMSRLMAILLTYSVIVILLEALLWAVIPSLAEQIRSLGTLIPNLAARAGQLLDPWVGNLPGDSFTNTIFSQLSQLGPALLRLPLTVTSVLSGILLILFISFYMLLEASRIQDFMLSLFPEERRGHINGLMIEMTQAMGGYFRGVVINGVIVGIVTFFGLLIIGVDFARVFGALAGLLELIPIAGPTVAIIIIVGLTFLQSPGLALATPVFMVILRQVENNILVP